jgi:hypothetical protein
MNSFTVKNYDLQYEECGGCWNKEICLRNGKIETYSGPGSLLENTDLFVEKLNEFIKENNIKSIIDVPCGDFNFMCNVDLNNINYLGLDISKKAIEICKNKINKPNICFQVLDITNEEIQYADLIIIKDLFLHLSFSDIHKILDNVIRSGSKFLAVSRYSHGNEINKDQESGLGCRAIEITTKPFNFKYPIVFKTYNTKLQSSSKPWMTDEMIFFKLN